ncbi:Ribosomal RNA small subunit methyltransferase F [Kluyvera intermedia]|nr:Ribosomal RNA small subunit methyltransferase F [Kluyvera intermedia]
MREAMPAHLSYEAFIDACQRPLRRSIRVNTLKITVDDFLALVAPYSWQLTPVPWCAEGFWIERENEDELPLGSTAEHLSGLFLYSGSQLNAPCCRTVRRRVNP